MIRQKHIAILKEADHNFKDREFFNSASDILSLEINGNFEGTIFLEGRNDDSHEWASIAAFNLSTLNTILNGFS
jgi:hypothetical protein